MRKIVLLLAVFAVAGLSTHAENAVAQEPLTLAWAEPMMGSWEARLDTPDGSVPVIVTVRQAEGAVVVVLGNENAQSAPITRVTRSGDSLVARYEMDYQGSPIDAELRLKRDGANLATDWSFAGGAYMTKATATKR